MMNIVRNGLFATSLLLVPLAGCTAKEAPVNEVPEEAAVLVDEAQHADAAHAHDEHAAAHVHGEGGHEHHTHDAAAADLENLVLNDGKKWPMDGHTRDVIGEMHKTVAEVAIASAADGRRAGEVLDEQLKTLIRGCTMQGPAHDNLHVFLGAFMPEVNALASAESDSTLR